MEFYASWDNISTKTAWYRPSLHALINIWKELNSKHNLENYEVYLAGGFAEYLHNPTIPLTWDMDICFVNDNPNYAEIKSILDDVQKLGFKYESLVDVKCVSKDIWDYFEYLHNGEAPPKDWWLGKNKTCYYNWIKFTKIIDGVVEIETDLSKSYNFIKVYDGLYKIEGMGDKLEKKVLDKINSNIYKGINVNLKTTDFNFVT